MKVIAVMLSTPDAYKTDFESRFLEEPPMPATSVWGQVTQIGAQSVHIRGLSSIIRLGDLITIRTDNGSELRGEIISLQNEISIAMMHGSPLGLRVGIKAYITEDRMP